MKAIVKWLTVVGYFFPALVQAQEIITFSTRPGVTQSYFLAKAPENPQAIAVLFPGAVGLIHLRKEGDQIKFDTGNFLVRTRSEFVKRGVVAAILDAPSDRQSGFGMSDEFRFSEKHFADISAVVDDLCKRFPGLPLFLIGTSRGTVSAAALAVKFGQQIAGVVLTSTSFQETGMRAKDPGPGLSRFNFKTIKIPLLFVHHVSDRCVTTPYGDAARLSKDYPLITVSGGLSPKSDECEPLSAHGYYGRESETVEEIVNWMLKKPFRSKVE
jgi:alpha-beta hydrolase superfamily lysophospholipase